MDLICSTTVATSDVRNTTTLLPYIYQLYDGIFLIVIVTCIILVGFIGNITFIWTVIRVPSLHTSTYIYLTSLACSDLCSLIGSSGIFIYEIFIHIHPYFRLKNRYMLQRVSEMVSTFFFIWSLCLVTLVSLERYLAICHPIKHHLLKGTHRAFKMIAVTFLFTFTMSGTIVPDIFDYSLLQLYFQITYIIYVGFFLSCLLYNCYMYVGILQTLKQRQCNRGLQLSPEFERNIQQMAIMVIANGVTFFIFSSIVAAYIITSLLNLFTENIPKELYYDEITFENIQVTAVVLNASVNPIIFFLTNRRYRSALKTLIMRLCCRSRYNWTVKIEQEQLGKASRSGITIKFSHHINEQQ